MTQITIVGLSASLRGARSRAGSSKLIDEISALANREALDSFIAEQAKIHLDQFVQAGRAEGIPFDQLYRRLQRTGGLRGLSNSEVCLAAALWGAAEHGTNIRHVSLSEHFPADGSEVGLDDLKRILRQADGILLATPVYFGDRSSLSQRLIETIRRDPALRTDLAGRVYAGIAVGAKRNGGQETALIYQMMDMAELGLLAVGNDSDTTSQYGGTAHAGDIGTIPADTYGLNTSVGTGRRIARVTTIRAVGRDEALSDPLRLGVWLLQDRDATAETLVDELLSKVMARTDTPIRPIAPQLFDDPIRPCIACDICPTHVGPDDEYRCIINRRDDGMRIHHAELLDCDVILPVVYCPEDHQGLQSVYQQFMERTRYIRRGDYILSDHLVAPMVFADVGTNEHMDVRIATSFLRHHTVISKPLVGWMHDGALLNRSQVEDGLQAAVTHGARLLAGRLRVEAGGSPALRYRPVGYVLAPVKDKEPATLVARTRLADERHERLVRESDRRLEHQIRRAARIS